MVDKIKNEQNFILTTDRLFLRKLCKTDFDNLCEILQDKETMYTYEHTLSDEEVKGWYDKQIDRYKKDGFGLWTVIHKNTDDFLGVCGLTIQNINEIEYLEIGYMFKMK
ncbi:MAG: GNAT family N-acetyltransferase [Candidatus Cloacimonetes bacterium]|nr:GNAT family N-acetyltransferase [Candidatus Cloacimonadota bacterium]